LFSVPLLIIVPVVAVWN